jgi:hypothetical protein
VSLAVRSGHLPDEWARQDPEDIATALMIFDQQDQQRQEG